MILKTPIVQGGMGVGISLGNLAGAVAKEGGIGLISAAQIGFKEEDFETNPLEANLRAIEKEYKKARNIAPDGTIGFNIMVAMKHYEDYVRKAVDAGADIIVSGAGLPTELPAYVKGSDTKIAPIVSTNKSAKVILKYWDKKHGRTADMVVIEGPKAGGHLGFQKDELKLYTDSRYLEEILEIKKTIESYGEKYGVKIPVVVAGGIDSPEQVKQMLDLGFDGVQVGSRFVTTEECDAHIRYKEAYINAKKEDIIIVKSPVGMPGRAIKNKMMDRIMQGEKLSPKKCYQCLAKCNPAEIPYCITKALIEAAEGNVDDALLFCGANAYKADKIETVKEVIANLLKNVYNIGVEDSKNSERREQNMDTYKVINDILVHLFNEIWELEEKAIITEEFKDISNNDMHIIEAIGLGEGNNMSTIAKKLNITVGSLTTSMNSLVNKKYAVRIRSEVDRRVVYIQLTKKGERAYRHHEDFHTQMTQAVLDKLGAEEIPVLLKTLNGLSEFFQNYHE